MLKLNERFVIEISEYCLVGLGCISRNVVFKSWER